VFCTKINSVFLSLNCIFVANAMSLFADLLYYIYTVKKKWFLGNFGDSGFLLIFMIYSFYNPIYPPKTTEVTTSVVFLCAENLYPVW